MFLRAEDGFYKGEIREFAPEAARALLASGRAENPFADGGIVPPAQPVVVGDQVIDHVLPPATAEKLAIAATRGARKRR